VRGRRADFYGGRYRIVPNGVRIPGELELARAAEQAADADEAAAAACAGPAHDAGEPLRIVFIGQAVARKGLPVLPARVRGAARARAGDANARRRVAVGGSHT